MVRQLTTPPSSSDKTLFRRSPALIAAMGFVVLLAQAVFIDQARASCGAGARVVSYLKLSDGEQARLDRFQWHMAGHANDDPNLPCRIPACHSPTDEPLPVPDIPIALHRSMELIQDKGVQRVLPFDELSHRVLFEVFYLQEGYPIHLDRPPIAIG